VRNLIRSTAFGIALMAVSLGAIAGTVIVPNTFTAGTPAKAADVNANFSAVATAVNASAENIATLQTTVKNMPAGPQGPAGTPGTNGSAGAQGPQGAQGPAGTGAMLVKDSTGKLVGSYFVAPYDPLYHPVVTALATATPAEFAFIRTASQSFAVRISSSVLGAQVDYNVSFLSTNCTGQAYIIPEPVGTVQFL
jgi:hypothetical protein